jgi:hypothetical protein
MTQSLDRHDRTVCTRRIATRMLSGIRHADAWVGHEDFLDSAARARPLGCLFADANVSNEIIEQALEIGPLGLRFARVWLA